MDPVVLPLKQYRSRLNKEYTAGWHAALARMAGPSMKLLDRIDQYENEVDADETLDPDHRIALLTALGMMRAKSPDLRYKGSEQFARLRKLIGIGSRTRSELEKDRITDKDLEF